MRRGRRLYAVAAMLLACLGLLACETGPTEEEQRAAALAAEWEWLQQAKTELDGKREELKALRDQIADHDPEAAAQTAGEGEEEAATAPPTLEELETQADAMQEEIYGLSDTYGGRLAQFINDQGISVGSELTPVQRQALDMKADEDILLAQEYIDKGGEYQRAIDIYNQSLVFDAGNEELLAAKARAEELQYMSEERFSQVKKGMTEREVRELLGTPKASNVRQYEDRGVTGWYYPKPNREAAAVFFQEKKGKLRVYKLDFDAVKAGEDVDES